MRSVTGSFADSRLLLVDGDRTGCRLTLDDLKACLAQTARLHLAACGREAVEALRKTGYDIVIVDLSSLDDLSPVTEEAVGRLARLADGALIIALAEGSSVSAALAAMRAGAHDYVAKPINAETFRARLEELAERHGKPCALSGGASLPVSGFESFIGSSSQMQFVYEQIERIAPSPAPVFITGESGTGKHLCADALGRRGPGTARPFVTVNCGAIPRDLMEIELFGAAHGVFTGAVEDRSGAFEAADGGTLFLDEIGELDLSIQAKLLRVLQTNTITRVGESAGRPVNVRIICATNRNPLQLIAEQKFREDLFYRLHVLPIHLPPLRQRPGDILPLARHFLRRYSTDEHKQFSGFSPDAADRLLNHDWPGNVRQLQNLIQRIVVMFDGGEVGIDMVLAADIESYGHSPAARAQPVPNRREEILPMWKQEQRIIEEALAKCEGNIAQAAAALEISPSTIYRKKQSWSRAGDGLSAA